MSLSPTDPKPSKDIDPKALPKDLPKYLKPVKPAPANGRVNKNAPFLQFALTNPESEAGQLFQMGDIKLTPQQIAELDNKYKKASKDAQPNFLEIIWDYIRAFMDGG